MRSGVLVLKTILDLTPEQRQHIEEEIGPFRSITDFCSELLEATKENPIKEKLVEVLPWAAKAGKIVSEVTPLAKVLLKLVDEVLKEKDPETLGLLACSLAYQRAAALTLAQQGEPASRVPFENSLESAREQLRKFKADVNLAGFSLEAPLAHPFIWQADDAFFVAVRSAGYTDSEWRQIQARVHDQFRADLVEVLSHGETAARFEPFTKRLSLGDSSAAYAALNAHIERQRWLFEDRPVLNIEPFTLKDVYVDTDCGKLLWRDFLKSVESEQEGSGEGFDPFSEEFGGRHPLLETVLEYIRNPRFNDAIVIQGVPGCGKSCFTLRLANVLRREGLRPLRIRLKFLDLKKSLSEALAQVILLPEEDEDPALARLPRCSDPFLHDSVFQEKTTFGGAEICPYVLILDGWDEISVAVNEGFEIEVRRMLDNVRRQFLLPRTVKVRVVLTGRPSDAVERSQFLRDETPVLSVREYTADQLESYAANIKSSLDHGSLSGGAKMWREVNWDTFESVFASYRRDRSELDILGLPLLAHLSLRLLAQWHGGFEPLLSNRTTLYRHLLDLTCAKAGKDPSDPDDLLGQARIKGDELRRMLRQTAVAITAYGNESIPFRELQLRLKKNRKQAMEEAESASKEHPLTNLMISFYFKGGHEHLGCEFLHKSFREYLYAEAIIEKLKEHGRKLSGTSAMREQYWADFQESDPRRHFSRNLSQMLCSRPLTAEIETHIANLIDWDIARSIEKEKENATEQSLNAVTARQWEVIREGLHDLWDWWGEGVHLRPQPYRDDSDNLRYQSAFVNELIDYSLPRDRGPDAPEWWPGRLLNADANLGDALCQLNAWVHSAILRLSGWDGVLDEQTEQERECNTPRYPYQTRFERSDKVFVVFRPAGSTKAYFQNYCSRINAAGYRPTGKFPGPIGLPDVDLREVDLDGAKLARTNLSGADLSRAHLSRAFMRGANLREANLSNAILRGANLGHANFIGANLSKANLSRTDLRGADLSHANLDGTILVGANLSGAIYDETDLRGAKLANAQGLRRDKLASPNSANRSARDNLSHTCPRSSPISRE